MTAVTFTYTNWRGETAKRTVKPIRIQFEGNEYHECQWLLHAWDVDKNDKRTFAIKDIKDWKPVGLDGAK